MQLDSIKHRTVAVRCSDFKWHNRTSESTLSGLSAFLSTLIVFFCKLRHISFDLEIPLHSRLYFIFIITHLVHVRSVSLCRCYILDEFSFRSNLPICNDTSLVWAVLPLNRGLRFITYYFLFEIFARFLWNNFSN